LRNALQKWLTLVPTSARVERVGNLFDGR
jgi:hypothetical protein